MGHLTASLARLVADDWRDALTDAQRGAMTEIVRVAFVDTAACILSGRDDPASTVASHWADGRYAGREGCSVAFGPRVHGPEAAALANGVLGHALDFDDVGLAGHPSVVLMPALWALHEFDDLRGFALVQAYAKGYAVWAELQRRQRSHLHAVGWHPTAVFGTLAATACVASLKRLPPRQVEHALGIAASMAGGVIGNFGSMTKPLHAGLAAERAMAATDLAATGFTASGDAIDGDAGLLRALSGDAADRLGPCADDAMLTLLHARPGIKKYPVCYAAHRIIDGMLELGRRHRIDADRVVDIELSISETTAAVMKHHAPTTVTEARFSAEFCAAVALLRGRVGIAQLALLEVMSPQVRRAMSTVRIVTLDTSCPFEPSFALADRVRIRLKDGSLLDSGDIRFAKGHAQDPIGKDALLEKFRGCLADGESELGDRILRDIDTALAE